MDLAQFAALHVPTLAAYEVRFSIHIALLTSTEMEVPLDLRLWSLGAPGHCAMQWPGRATLGGLDRAECQQRTGGGRRQPIAFSSPSRWLPMNVTSGSAQLLQKRVSAGSRTYRRVRVRACKRVEIRSVQRRI